jgi:hypothetical protein
LTVGPPHERLAALEGDWMGEEVLADDGAARGRYRFGTAIDGLFLLGDYQQDRGSGVDARGHAVLGWDADAERYALWWFDSSGALPSGPATGSWDGATLVLERAGVARYSFTAADERLQVRIEQRRDESGWVLVREGFYSRA